MSGGGGAGVNGGTLQKKFLKVGNVLWMRKALCDESEKESTTAKAEGYGLKLELEIKNSDKPSWTDTTVTTWNDPRNRRAIATCRECPVRVDCLEYAMTLENTNGRWGIYGGLRPAERAQLQKQRNRMRRAASTVAAAGVPVGGR